MSIDNRFQSSDVFTEDSISSDVTDSFYIDDNKKRKRKSQNAIQQFKKANSSTHGKEILKLLLIRNYVYDDVPDNFHNRNMIKPPC